MRYADTCLLLSLIYRDSGSEAALAWLEHAGTGEILISHWSLTEFVSAAGIMARRGDIDARLHREGIAHCRRFVAARLQVEPPNAADFERAAVWLEDYASGLRAGMPCICPSRPALAPSYAVPTTPCWLRQRTLGWP
jgi:uncharacterized protein